MSNRKNQSEELRVKFLFDKRIGGAWGNEPDEENAVICIRAADFDTHKISHRTNNLTRRSFSEEEINNKGLLLGDLIIEKSGGGENQPVGRVALFQLNETALCSNFLEVLRPNTNRVLSQFAGYVLYSLWSNRTVIAAIKQTTGIQNLDIGDYLDNKIALPKISRQKEIIAFLQSELKYIDALIDQKQRSVSVLVEKKRVLISNAITHGIDPSVKMKNSEIPWINCAPAHWKKTRLKFLGNIFYGLSQPPEYQKEGTALVRATNIFRGEIKSEGVVYVNENEIGGLKKITLQIGDIIVVRSGAYTGDSAIITSAWAGSIAGFDMIFRSNSAVCPEFLAILFLSEYVLDCQLIPASSRAAQPHLNAEELGNVMIELPPLPEQIAIVKHLHAKLKNIEDVMNATKRSIDFLMERREILISDTVTGQMEIPAA